MTPAEIVASFMEERPEDPRGHDDPSPFWWRRTYLHEKPWEPREVSLDGMRLVEERLNCGRTWAYDNALQRQVSGEYYVWHASAEQKLAALAEVLRGVVEKAKDPKAGAEVKA